MRRVRCIQTIFAFLILMLFFSYAVGENQTIEGKFYNGFEYVLNEDGNTLSIIRYTGTNSVVFIPSEIGGNAVKKIEAGSFDEQSYVVFPEGDISIDDEAFAKPESMRAFVYSGSAAERWVRDHIRQWGILQENGSGFLYAVDQLTREIVLVQYHGDSPVAILPHISGRTIDEVLPEAFIDCERIVFLENEITIAEEACNNPSEVIATVYPGTAAKRWADKLGIAIDFLEGQFVVDNVSWEYLDGKMYYYGPTYEAGRITIPSCFDGLQVQAVKAIGSVKKLEEVIIEDGVEEIEEAVFANAAILQRVVLPNNLRVIKDRTFYNCKALEEINLPDGLMYINDRAFYGCESIECLRIPKTVRWIGNEALTGMTSLKEIDVEEPNEDYRSIDGVLFRIGGVLNQLTYYPSAKADIDYSIPEGTIAIHTRAFDGVSSLQSLDIPGSVVDIHDEGIQNMPNLRSVRFHEGLSFIGKSVLVNCPQIMSVTIPGTVESVGDGSLSHLESLRMCVFEEGVHRIGPRVLDDDDNLVLVYLPMSLTSIGQTVDLFVTNPLLAEGGIAGSYLKNQEVYFVVKERSYAQEWAIEEDSDIHHIWMNQKPGKTGDTAAEFQDEYDQTVICSVSGSSIAIYVEREPDKIWLHRLVENSTSVFEIPAGINGYQVTGIDENAFCLAPQINQVTLPDTIEIISKDALKGTSLTQIRIPDSVKTVGEGAFQGIDVKELIIPGSITNVPDEAFALTLELEDLTIEEGVESIGSKAFFRSSLRNVFLPSSINSIAQDAFDHSQNTVFYVTNGSYAERVCTSYGYKIEYSEVSNESAQKQSEVQFDDHAPIIFPNESVEQVVRYELGRSGGNAKAAEPIYPLDVVEIEQLDLSSLGIYSLDFLRCFVGLRRLCIGAPNTKPEWSPQIGDFGGNNMYADLSPLSGLTELEELDISFCFAEDISVLGNLKKLKKLDLRGVWANDYSCLSELELLEELSLWETNIADVLPLSNLKQLRRLNLDNTNVSSIAALAQLENLEYLSLWECPTIVDKEVLFELPALREVWIEVYDKSFRDALGDRIKPGDSYLPYQ